MLAGLNKLTILGAGVGIFLISFGLYGAVVEKDQKIQQAANKETLLDAEKKLNDILVEVELWEKYCIEGIPKENEEESTQCFSVLKQKRMELTSAHTNVYDIKSKLGLE